MEFVSKFCKALGLMILAGSLTSAAFADELGGPEPGPVMHPGTCTDSLNCNLSGCTSSGPLCPNKGTQTCRNCNCAETNTPGTFECNGQ